MNFYQPQKIRVRSIEGQCAILLSTTPEGYQVISWIYQPPKTYECQLMDYYGHRCTFGRNATFTFSFSSQRLCPHPPPRTLRQYFWGWQSSNTAWQRSWVGSSPGVGLVSLQPPRFHLVFPLQVQGVFSPKEAVGTSHFLVNDQIYLTILSTFYIINAKFVQYSKRKRKSNAQMHGDASTPKEIPKFFKKRQAGFWFLVLCGVFRVIYRNSPIVSQLNANFKNFGKLTILNKNAKTPVMLGINQICSPVFIMSPPIQVVFSGSCYSGSLLIVAVLNQLRMHKCNNQTKNLLKKYKYKIWKCKKVKNPVPKNGKKRRETRPLF